MSNHTPAASLQRLQESVVQFITVIRPLSDAVFLQQFTDWSPRDVTAHLIGWNYYTLEAVDEIRRAMAPAYLNDFPNNFATVNAASVKRYAATDKDTLLRELETSAAALVTRLQHIPAQEWLQDFGARNPIGQPVFIQRQVDGLSDDYRAHAHEVEQWVNSHSSPAEEGGE